ncbi:hypothetical protein AKO1_014412 [Acrasis kona]|uniref:Ras family small GTPase n=1 Tax=Acrasis kona TaxID=1008807 RepID=A0AAW2YYJ0_9EUKA
MQSDDIIRIISSYIGPSLKDVLNLNLVSKQYQQIFDSDPVWSQIWKNKYPLQPDAFSENFKFCYSQLHLLQKTTKVKTTPQQEDIKTVVLGSGGAGKSCLVVRYIVGQYVAEYDPTIEDAYRKFVKVGDKGVFLDILDTAGPEEYSSMRNQYMNYADYVIICYDCTCRKSFDEVKNNYYNFAQTASKKKQSKVVIVECKRDTEIHNNLTYVDQKEARDYAQSVGAPFFTTSALCDINIEEPFRAIAEDSLLIDSKIIERLKSGKPVTASERYPDKKNKCVLC